MMAIVVNEPVAARHAAVGGTHGQFAVLREAAPDAAEFRQPAHDGLVGNAHHRSDGHGGQRVPHIVDPWQIEHDGQRRMIGPQHREGHLSADGAHVDRAHLSIGREAVEDHGLRHARTNLKHMLIVGAQHGHPVKGKPLEKIHEGRLQVFEAVAVRVHVVFVDVGDGRDHGRQIQKRSIGLVRFGDEKLARAQPCVCTCAVEPSADHEGRIQTARSKQRRGQRGRRGLAVRARNGDAAAKAHQLGKHDRARDNGNAQFARGDDLGVVLMHGRRNHHGVSPADVFLVVAAEDARAKRLQTIGHGAFRQIRAAHDVAQIEHHFRDAAHARTADADKMQVVHQKLHA